MDFIDLKVTEKNHQSYNRCATEMDKKIWRYKWVQIAILLQTFIKMCQGSLNPNHVFLTIHRKTVKIVRYIYYL